MFAQLNSDLETHGIEPLGAYAEQLRALSNHEAQAWANRPLSYKFSAINSVLANLGNRKASTTESEILVRISATITASQRYKKLIIKSAQNSADQLTQNSRDAAIWLNLPSAQEETQQTMLIRLHHTMMYQAQKAFGISSPIGRKLEAATINFYQALNGKSGYVARNPKTGQNEVFVNLHPDVIKAHHLDLADTMAHETSHIIDDIVADAYDENSQSIPDWLQDDAQRLSLARKFNAYITPKLSTAGYALQSEEDQAFEVGCACMRQFSRNLNIYCPV